MLIRTFTSGAEGELVERLRHLLDLVCILVLFEGSQTILSGIVEVWTQSCCSLADMLCPQPCSRAEFWEADGFMFWPNLVPLCAMEQGTGKQLRGAVINLASYYVVAVPLAMLLAFPGSQGVEGLYAGLCMGPAIQVHRLLAHVIEHTAEHPLVIALCSASAKRCDAGGGLRSTLGEVRFQVHNKQLTPCALRPSPSAACKHIVA